MATNTLWWQRQVGGKVFVSAHNGHIAYRSPDPEQYPKLQGAFLRDRLGSRFVAIGLTFGQGSFNAVNANGHWQRFTVGPAEPDSNEYVLDGLHDEDFLLDLRHGGLRGPRPTYDIGGEDPGSRPRKDISLGHSFDALIHFHQVHAATRLP
jgi:erythromycin esterase